MNVLLIKALDDAHLYSVQTRALCAALNEAGVSAEVFDVFRDREGFADAVISTHRDAVISFSSFLGALSLEDGRSIYDAVGSRFLGWQFDHPIYVHHHIANPMAQRSAIYPSESHLRFNAEAGLPCPSKVMLPGGEAPAGDAPDYRDRRMPVFVAATWNGEPARAWETLGDSPATRLMAQVAERLRRDRARSLIDAFHAARDNLGLGGLELSSEVIALLRIVLNYVRHRDRLDIVESLVRSALPLTVCGAGWREHLGERPGLTYLDSAPFSAMGGLYRDARIVLNLNAANGGSERAIDAALNGACVVSDYGATLAGAFEDGREIALFDLSASTTATEVIAELLEGGRGEAMAQAGHERAMGSALWRHRVGEVLDLLR